MLKKLRSLSSDAKKKIVVFCAGSMTFLVFIFWISNSFGTFSETFGETKEKGALVYSAIEENVGKVYNAFEKIIPKKEDGFVDLSGSSTNATSTTETATTTSATSTGVVLE
jgi:hypothetical protein